MKHNKANSADAKKAARLISDVGPAENPDGCFSTKIMEH